MREMQREGMAGLGVSAVAVATGRRGDPVAVRCEIRDP